MSIFSSSKSKTYTPYEKTPDEYKGIIDPYYAKIFSPQYYNSLLGDLLSGMQTQRAGRQRGMEQNLALRGLSHGSGLAGYEQSKLDRSYLSNIANAYLKAKAMEEERRRLAISGMTGMFGGGGNSSGAGLGYSMMSGLPQAAGQMGAGWASTL